MSPTVASTMDSRAGTAVRVDVRRVAETEPWLVDQWLFTSVCGHPDCQIVITMGSLDPARNSTPIEGVLEHYSHMVTVHANRDTHNWTPADLSGDADLLSESVFSQPIAVPDDQAARAVCHLLIRDIVAGAVPPQTPRPHRTVHVAAGGRHGADGEPPASPHPPRPGAETGRGRRAAGSAGAGVPRWSGCRVGRARARQGARS